MTVGYLPGLFADRAAQRFLDLADDYDDEAAQAAISGDPARAQYLNFLSARLRERAIRSAQGYPEPPRPAAKRMAELNASMNSRRGPA